MATVLAVTAATVVTTATASFAVDTVTLSRTHGPSGGGYTLTISPTTAATFTGGTGPFAVQFNIAGTCPGPIANARPTTAAVAGTTTVSAGIVETLVAKAALVGNDLPVTVPSGLALPATVTAPTAFSVCVYDTAVAANDALLAGANAGFTVDAGLTSDPTSGASGGGYPITVTADSPVFDDFNAAGHVVQFQAATTAQPACATAPMGASAPTASNATTMTGGVITVPAANIQVPTTTSMTVNVPATLAQVASPQVLAANYNICVYKTSNGLLLAETVTANQFTVSGNIALSTTSGSSNGGNSVSLTAASAIFTAGSINVQLQGNGATTCGTHYASSNNVNVPTTRFITTSKIAMTLPTSGLPTTTTPYVVCVYDTTNTGTSNLIAQSYGTYTVGQVPTVTSVSPATGPAEGGATITVTGANFPTTPGAMTATVGGTPLLNVSVINATSFTGIVPAHVPGPAVSIAVTTAGGTSETKSLFTFTNGITVTPKTGSNSKMTSTDLDITGVGFSDLTFGTAFDTNSTKAHVYLVKGSYDPTGTTTKANGQVNGGDCVDVLVISDKDLVCSLYLGGNYATAPTATTRNLTGCASTNSTGTVGSVATAYLGPATATSTCTFSASDVGMKLSSGTIIPDNSTTIASVSSAGIATLNKATAAAVLAATAITASSSRTMAASDGTFSTNTVSSTNVPFTAGDVGKVITGTGIPTGTYISAVNSGTATLSQTPTTPSGTLTIFTPAAIPNGTYTVTVVTNGAPGAQTSATYMKSIISSGSTFTVADY